MPELANVAKWFAVPAILVLVLAMLLILLFGLDVLDRADDEAAGQVVDGLKSDEASTIKLWMLIAIPAGMLLFPLKYMFTVALQRSKVRQMGAGGVDDYTDLEMSYRDHSHDLSRRGGGPFQSMIGEIRATILPTAKVKVLKRRLRDPRLVISQGDIKAVLAEFKEPANRAIAQDLLHAKMRETRESRPKGYR